MKNIFNIFLLALCSLLFASCGEESKPENPTTTGKSYALAICEGLYGVNNSSLTIVDLDSGTSQANYFRAGGEITTLGDTAFDLYTKEDTAWVSVSTSKSILKIKISTGELLARLHIERESFPRQMAFASGELAYCADLYDNSVFRFNPRTMQAIGEPYHSGPQPEGLALSNGKLFAVNSGYGDIGKDHPQAGTVSVIDAASGNLLKNFYVGPNAVEIAVDDNRGKLYVCYYNLPSKPDSLGGIVEYDLNTLEKLRETRVRARSMKLHNGKVYFIEGNLNASDGISYIDPSLGFDAHRALANPYPKRDIWYGFEFFPKSGGLLVANAMNYQMPGKLDRFDASMTYIRSYPAGVNPSKIFIKE